MLNRFRPSPKAEVASDPSQPSSTMLVPLEPSQPSETSWRDHVEGALATTWQAGTDFGSAVASGAVDAASRAAQGASDAAGFVGRYGSASAGTALTVAGNAVSGLSRVGGAVIDLAVVSPTSVATRSAATVADVAIVKPARAISRFVLIALGIVCGSAVAVAGFLALAMYFYHAGGAPTAAPAPTIVVLQPGQAIVPQPSDKSVRPRRAAADE